MNRSLMPKGVEHPATAVGRITPFVVNRSLMPKGVSRVRERGHKTRFLEGTSAPDLAGDGVETSVMLSPSASFCSMRATIARRPTTTVPLSRKGVQSSIGGLPPVPSPARLRGRGLARIIHGAVAEFARTQCVMASWAEFLRTQLQTRCGGSTRNHE